MPGEDVHGGAARRCAVWYLDISLTRVLSFRPERVQVDSSYRLRTSISIAAVRLNLRTGSCVRSARRIWE